MWVIKCSDKTKSANITSYYEDVGRSVQNHNLGGFVCLVLTLFCFACGGLFLFLFFIFTLPTDIAVNILTLTKENAMTLHCNIETNVTQEISLYLKKLSPTIFSRKR